MFFIFDPTFLLILAVLVVIGVIGMIQLNSAAIGTFIAIILLFMMFLAVVISAKKSKNDPIVKAQDYSEEFENNRILRNKLFFNIEQAFKQQLKEIHRNDQKGLYAGLFEKFSGSQYTPYVRFDVETTENYIYVRMKAQNGLDDVYSFVQIDTYLPDYNIILDDNDYNIRSAKMKGLSIATMKWLLNVLPDRVSAKTFAIKKDNNDFSPDRTLAKVEKKLTLIKL